MLCLGKIHENPQSNDAWEDRLVWFKSSPEYRNFDRIDGKPMEFEWHIFPGFNTLHLSEQVKRLLLRLDETPENFTGRIIFMSMFNDISCGAKDNEKNAWQMPNSYLCTQGDLEKDNGHLLVLVQKRSGTVSVKTVHKEYGTILLKGCWWNSQKADVSSKTKAVDNCRHTTQPVWKRLRLFRIIVSTNQFSL